MSSLQKLTQAKPNRNIGQAAKSRAPSKISPAIANSLRGVSGRLRQRTSPETSANPITSQTPKSLTGHPARFSQNTGNSKPLRPKAGESSHCCKGGNSVGQRVNMARPSRTQKPKTAMVKRKASNEIRPDRSFLRTGNFEDSLHKNSFADHFARFIPTGAFPIQNPLFVGGLGLLFPVWIVSGGPSV